MSSAVVDQPCGYAEQPVADGGSGGEFVGWLDSAEVRDPPVEVMGEGGDSEPGGVGPEPP